MPIAIILGLPKSQADRIKGELKKNNQAWCSGWSVIFVPPTGKQDQIREADTRVAFKNAINANTSVHILAIVNQGGGRKQEIASDFVPFFRFRCLPGEWLALPHPSPEMFIDKVNEIFSDENDWICQVKPKETSEPLLLPKTGFLTKLSDLWELAEKYGEGCNVGFARRKDEFFRVHYRRHTFKKNAKDYLWIDNDNRIFDHTQARHGQAPDDRRWKYSFRLPDGFHYDVRHGDNRKFTINGAINNKEVEVGGYVNLDPHGYFR